MPLPAESAVAGRQAVSRRQMLRSVVGGLAAGAWKPSVLGMLLTTRARADRSLELVHRAVAVPPDFVGMHAHRWPDPVSPLVAPPRYQFGAARSHDHEGVSWNQIHLGPGRYAWEALDRWVAAHSEAGRTLIYTLYGTPAWLAQRTDQKDLYGRPGGASAPRELEPLRDFVAALVARYNTGGRRRVQLLETWNEPRFDGRVQDFWWGSAEQLAAVGRAVYLAAKGVDRGVRVLSPGFNGDLAGGLSLTLPLLVAARRSAVYQYLTAADGHGGSGRAWCEGLAFHTYNVPLAGENVAYLLGIAKLQKMLELMQCRLPIVNTECGFLEGDPFRRLAPAQQAVQLKRLAVMQAAVGVQAVYFYSHDDAFVGNPAVHAEVGAAIQELHERVAGSVLRQVSLEGGGSVRVVTNRGAFTW